MMVNNPVLCEKANSVILNLYSLGYATVDTNWNGFVQNPSFSRLYYIVSGEAYIEYDNIKLSLLPGNWYLIPAGFSFHFKCDNEMEHLYFHITLSGVDEIDLLSKFTEPIPVADNTNPHLFYMDFLENESLLAALAIKENIYNIILKLMERNSTKPEIIEFSQCVQKAVEYINNNLFKKLDLTTIAKYAYVSKGTLTNKFKNELNITIQGYIQKQKMSRAEQMLKNSDMSIAEISERLGFSEQFYFSRCFKHNFGLSPLEYRKSKIN